MRVHSFERIDLVNTPGEGKPAFTIWFSGCSVRCKGCHNMELWNRNGGIGYTPNDIMNHMMMLPIDYESVVLLGGEPLEQNMYELTNLVMIMVGMGKKVWLYTSREFDEIPIALLPMLYTIKTGKYDEDLKTGGFPASSNQRVWRHINGEWTDITERMGSINANQYDTKTRI